LIREIHGSVLNSALWESPVAVILRFGDTMRQVPPYSLWIGNAGDVRRVAELMNAGIRAVIDLAANEPVAALPRELVYCRFPLLDGADNERWLLRAAIDMISQLLRNNAPTLVACSAGMSRSPALSAAAISLLTHRVPHECLQDCIKHGAADISPLLWHDVIEALRQ
jgi:Dual specificity phosphatase, catalytic domain